MTWRICQAKNLIDFPSKFELVQRWELMRLRCKLATFINTPSLGNLGFSYRYKKNQFYGLFHAYAGVGLWFPAAVSPTPHAVLRILPFQSTHSRVPLHRLTPCCPCSSSPPLALHTFTKSPSSQCNTYPSHFNHFPLTMSDADSTPILPLRSTHTHPSYHFHLSPYQ